MTTFRRTRIGADRQRRLIRHHQPVDRLRLLAHQVITVGLDLVFPPHCVHCDRVGSLLCPRCLTAIEPANPRALPSIEEMQVATDFQGAISDAIHAFKYKGQSRLAESLGDLVCHALREVDWQIDLVTAVPLHSARLRERGYNQAALLAAMVARTLGWAFAADAVARTRDTPSQVYLNAEERRANVAGAFCADRALIEGKRVLIVDDVLTTGATLSACAEALLAAGAAAVYGAAVAGAVFSGDAHASTSAAPG